MMDFCTHPCIALGTTGNWQGLTQCFDPVTGKVVVQCTINVLPMPDKIIKKLNWWGRSKKNMAFQNKLELLNRHGIQFDWDNED